jgi:chaperonin GroES
MKFRPLHDRVVVRRIDAEEKTAGGIIIPDTAKEKPQQGEVLAVGPGKRDETGKLVALGVREGDQILFGKWSGTEVKIDGEDLLIMKEDDIMGVVEGAAARSKGSGTSTTRRVGAMAAVVALGLLATLPFVGF